MVNQPIVAWVLIDANRLYWKVNIAVQNQKTRSFNLAKIVAIQPGKHTMTLKNDDDVDDSVCFSIVSKKTSHIRFIRRGYRY